MRVEHGPIIGSTPGRQDPACRYRLSVSPLAVFRTEFRRCDMAYTIEPENVGYPGAVQRVVEWREPLAFADPVPETGALPGFEYWSAEAPYQRLYGLRP